jgi:hypothetical protein
MRRCIFLLLLLSAFAPAQTTHGIAFTWPQSVTAGITGNDLYCGISSRAYTLKWHFTNPITAYDWLTTDPVNLPVQGQKYFCAVTASKAGIESGYSPEVSTTFPEVPVPPAAMQAAPH